MGNIDQEVIDDFGNEWRKFDQSYLSAEEHLLQFNCYFSIFPWEKISENAIGFDAGCGSGRWAKIVAPRVKWLHCIDPSIAIEVAKRNLSKNLNCSFYQKSIDELPFDDGSMDFGYSLGVLHHIPDTKQAMLDCVKKLKNGAPFLVYIYYSFDNQPIWYSWLWRGSDLIRRFLSKRSFRAKYIASQLLAVIIYFPLARTSLLVEKAGFSIQSWPLSSYRYRSFYSMRTDALDRFGTKLERRFSKLEIEKMMIECGLENILFSNNAPYYCAVGFKSNHAK